MLEAGFSCLLLLSLARLSKKYMSFIYQYLIHISFIYNWFVVVVLLRLIDFCGLIDFFFLFWFDFWDLYFFVVLDKLLSFIAEVGMRMLLMEALLWFIGWSTSVNDVIEASLHMLLWWWWWRWCHMLLGTIHSHLGYEMHRLCLAMLLSQTHRHRLRCSLGYNVVQRRYCLLCFLAFVVPASTNGAYNECWSVCVWRVMELISCDEEEQKEWRNKYELIESELNICCNVARWGFVGSITILYLYKDLFFRTKIYIEWSLSSTGRACYLPYKCHAPWTTC